MIEWFAPVPPSDFFTLSKVRLLECWQSDWDGGRHLHDKQDDGESFVPQESSGMDEHRVKSHVSEFTEL
jgi:hypothetical protein